jgi:O-antigen/teichoic acid export membrane protein
MGSNPEHRDAERGGAGDRRGRAVRGTLTNSGFLIGLTILGLVRTIVVARVLPVAEYGVWGILAAMIGVAFYLKDLGISDKFVQQDEPDQRQAFARAVNAETVVCIMLFLVLLAAVGLLSVVYHRPALIAPGAVLGTVILAQIYQSPNWIFYRRMDYKRQRLLQSADPIVGFVVTVSLAVVGLGYWSLVLGVAAGAWTVAALSVWASPFPVRPRIHLGGLREYRAFSGPLLITSAVGVIIDQLTVLLGTAVVGLAGVAALTLSTQVNSYAQQIETMVTDTLYPAVCAVKDRGDVMYESFVKSNRLGLLWAIPAGVGVALFFPDLVGFVIGTKWRHAEFFVEMMALIAALNVVGYSWTAYYRAMARTGAMARASLLAAVIYVAATAPAVLTLGLDGFIVGFALMVLINVYVRSRYLRQIFPEFRLASHIVRAVIPVVPGAALVLAARGLESGHRSLALALSEVAVFVLTTVAASYLQERRLIQEILAYITARYRPAPNAAVV